MRQYLFVFLFVLIQTAVICAQAGEKPELVVQSGHASIIGAAAYSPDGKYLASGGDDNKIVVWDAATGAQIRSLDNGEQIEAVAFTPDGRRLVVADFAGRVRVFDFFRGTIEREWKAHESYIISMQLSADGKFLYTSADPDGIKAWDMTSGREIYAVADDYPSLALSPDGKILASGGGYGDAKAGVERRVKLWNALTGKLLGEVGGTAGGTRALAFSRDGKFLAVGGLPRNDEMEPVRIWDVARRVLVKTISSPEKYVGSIDFSPTGDRIIYSARDGLVKVADLGSGKVIFSEPSGEEELRFVRFAPGDKSFISAGSGTNQIELWNYPNPKKPLAFYRGRVSNIWTSAFSADGASLAVGEWGDKIHIWNLSGATFVKTLHAPGDSVQALAFSPNGERLAAVSGVWRHSIAVWDVPSGKILWKIDDAQGVGFPEIYFSGDGKRFVVQGYETIYMCETETGECDGFNIRDLAQISSVYTPRPDKKVEPEFYISSSALSPNGNLLALSGFIKEGENFSDTDPRTTVILDIGKKEVYKTAKESGVAMRFSPDGKTLVFGEKNLFAWQFETSAAPKQVGAHKEPIKAMQFSSDGKELTTVDFKLNIKKWDVAARRETFSAENNIDSPQTTVSPDGKFLFTRDGEKLVLRDGGSGKELATLIALDEAEWVVVSPDGKFDASGEAQKLMHFVVGLEPIALEQLKYRYYEPSLLRKLIAGEKLRAVENLAAVKLFPAAEWSPPAAGATTFNIKLTNRGGGIGRVQVFVNGQEYIADARPAGFNPNQAAATLTVDLKNATNILSGKENKIEVVAWNFDQATGESWLSSPRGTKTVLLTNKTETAAAAPPEIYAIVGGVSDYEGDQIDLRFPSKDATDAARALEVGARGLGLKFHLKLLSTDASNKDAVQPTKANFLAAFDEVKRLSKPNDIFIVYLAGHGIGLGERHDTYVYLTKDASTADRTAFADGDELKRVGLTSDELVESMKVPALKKAMILDTCAAGALGQKFVEKRDLPADARRAVEFMKDRTGFYILMGSAADAVSYEASQYGQGLLTYTVLEAFRGAALDGDGRASVEKIFSYASERVPQLAKNIGGIQRPEIIAPTGGTGFAIGLLKDEAARAEVPLAIVKPLVSRPILQNREMRYDNLKLTGAIRSKLRDISFITARGENAPLVFVDAEEIPDSVLISGDYTIDGDNVKATVVLIRGEKIIAQFEATGTRADIADKIVALAVGKISTP